MRYPAVRICPNGSFALHDLPATDVYDPSEGSVLPRVPSECRCRVSRFPSVAGTSPGSVWATSPSP
jgi:hypothetical protein